MLSLIPPHTLTVTAIPKDPLCIHLENRDYVDTSEGDFFALALTEHLQEVKHDEHLWVRYSPEPLPDHPGAPLRLHPHFEAFIPFGRAINPVTKDNWEGRGVIPDTREKALDTAYKMALETVIEGIKEPSSRPLNKLLKEAQEALESIIN